MGSALISGMISSTVQPVLVEISDNRERQRNVFRKLLRFTAFLSFPAMFGLALIAPEFIEITIGSKWKHLHPLLTDTLHLGSLLPSYYPLHQSYHKQRQVEYLHVEYHPLRHSSNHSYPCHSIPWAHPHDWRILSA